MQRTLIFAIVSANNALKTLRDALKRGSFDGAYYVYGEDDFQKDDAVKQLVEAAIEPAMRDFNMETLRAQDTDAKSLDAALSALPMLAGVELDGGSGGRVRPAPRS